MSLRTIVVVLLVARLASAGADSSFAAAKSAYEAKQLDVAAVQFEQFVTAFPTDPRVGQASTMWLDVLGRDVEKLDHAIAVLMPLAAITGKDRERLERIAGLVAQAHAEQLAQAGNPLAAAHGFVDAAKLLVSQPQTRFTALFSAAVMFEQARDGTSAIATLREALGIDHLSPTERADALLRLAHLEELTDPIAAATDYLSVPDLCEKRCRDSADARFNAGQLFLAIGHYKAAAAAFATYGKDFPNEGDADRAALLVGHIAELVHDDAKAEVAYTAYLARAKPNQTSYANLRLGYAAAARGKRAKADQAFVRAAKDPAFAGEAKLAHAELLAHDAANAKLTVPVKKLIAALKERSRLIELAQRGYDDVATAHDDFWMIASLDRAAHLYDDFASALLAATPPTLDNEADKLSYRNQIELFASGITNKVIEGYRAAYDTALATNMHSEHELDAWRQLNRLDPKRYPREREAREGLRAEPAFVPAMIVLK